MRGAGNRRCALKILHRRQYLAQDPIWKSNPMGHGKYVETDGFPTFSGVHRMIFGSRNSECNILFHQFGIYVIGKHSPRLATRGHVGTCQTRTSGEGDTVDGKNPAPVDMADIPLFTGFHTCQVVRISSIKSRKLASTFFPRVYNCCVISGYGCINICRH